ncbi:MAG TPA: DegV family protein [Thermotogota bacterium]|nr:DegV family protein [Thermotogota bacterium]HRW92422.1 DegV family protein [Thermotogota bacterium]
MIGIVCDSGTDTPVEIVKKHAIEVVPLKVILGQEEFRDADPGVREKTLAYMEHDIPKTSLPGFEEVWDAFQRLKDRGCGEIIAINISSQLSGTHNFFKMVAEKFLKENPQMQLEVVNTLNISVGAGFYVMEAARLAESGQSFATVVADLKAMIPSKSSVWFVIPTLKYLKAGGRIGKVSATIGEILNLKPVIAVGDDGIYYTAGKARGIKNAVEKLLEKFDQAFSAKKVEMAAVYRADDNPQTLDLVQRVMENLKKRGVTKIFQGLISSSLFVHVGPGLVGLGALG